MDVFFSLSALQFIVLRTFISPKICIYQYFFVPLHRFSEQPSETLKPSNFQTSYSDISPKISA